MTDYEAAKKILQKYNQEQILVNYEKLSDKNKELLINQILRIDFDQVHQLYEATVNRIENKEDIIAPISYIDKLELSEEEVKICKEEGAEYIKRGEYAALTMAGGQRNEAWTYWTKRNIYVGNRS